MRTALLVLLAAFLAACSHAGNGITSCSDCDASVPPPECTQTSDCPEGHYCTPDQHCALGCAIDADCGAGRSCCGNVCIPSTADPTNCGGCGVTCDSGASCCGGTCTQLGTLSDCSACGDTCAAGDFCDGAQCDAPTYPNFCANKTVYVIYDGITDDINAASLMASTITANCPADVVVQTANQTDAAFVDQTTGQPLGGTGVTYVLAGGPYADMPVKWLEDTQQVTSVYFATPDSSTFAWMERNNATPVATMPAASCSAHFDQFVVELVTDPVSGTLSLIGYGACVGGRGTFGAAYYYANVMLPNVAMYPDSWYVLSWDDTSGDSVAGPGDTFTVLAHGT